MEVSRLELEELVRFVRGLDPAQIFDTEERWDSLDHLEILSKLRNPPYSVDPNLDLSDATCFEELAEICCAT